MMACFKIIAWNCGGLRDSAVSKNKALFLEKGYKTDFDVAFFIETHHKSINDLPPEILRYENTHHIVHSPAKNETHAGIIGLIGNAYEILHQEELIPGRMLNVKIQCKNDKSIKNITAVYFETNNNLNKVKLENIVAKLRQENHAHQNNIIIGDFNFIDNEKDKINGLNQKDRSLCDIWIPFLAEVDLVDPFREHNPNRKIWSFIGTGKAKNSRIDRVYVNTGSRNNITNFEYTRTPFQGHKILTFQIKSPNEKGRGYYKMNTSVLSDPMYRGIVEETLVEIEQQQITDEIKK